MTGYQQLADVVARLWPLVADHLWQATLFFLMVFLLTVVLRRGPAQLRYALWLIAAVKLILPSQAMVFLVQGSGLDRYVPSKSVIPTEPIEPHSITVFSGVREQAFRLADPAASLSNSTLGNREIYLAITALWLLGLAIWVGRWWKRRRQFVLVIQGAETLAVGREVEALRRLCAWLSMEREIQLVISPQVIEPGLWGVRKPIIVLPESLPAHLRDSELETLLLHELVHVRRRDNLISYFQMVLGSFFWFYPVMWIIDRKLVVERELACDEEVLRLGRSSDDYASSLWKVVRFCLGRSIAGVSLVTGSNLKRRIEKIMSGKIQAKLAWQHRVFLVGSVISMIGLSLSIGVYSQGATGKLSGSVHDASRATIPGATVTISKPGAGTKEITSTNDVGEYEFRSLPKGKYEVEVDKEGFKAYQRKDVIINGNAQERLDVIMEVGEVLQTIDVRAKSPRAAAAPSSASGQPHRIRVGGNVQQANLISETKPIYPELARQAGIEGTVLLEAIIGKEGNVVNFRVVNTLVNPELVKAAVAAVKQWLYKPTLLNGEPIEVVTTIRVNFSLAQAE
jgi:TonB family protein